MTHIFYTVLQFAIAYAVVAGWYAVRMEAEKLKR